MKKLLIVTALLAGVFTISRAQCTFDPTVTGDTLMCPGEVGSLTTQPYDSYQWYKRAFGGTFDTLLVGDTFQSLSIDQFIDAGFYFSVDATMNGCTERSPLALVDAWAFLPVVVASAGSFTAGINGESVICIGDTMYFVLQQPYDTNITWYKNSAPVAGATSDTLVITEAGLYTVQGAPTVCPNYIQTLGLILEVDTMDCSTSIGDLPNSTFRLFPNPVSEFLHISFDGFGSVSIYDPLGAKIESKYVNQEATIDTRSWASGVYIVEFSSENGNLGRTRLVVR